MSTSTPAKKTTEKPKTAAAPKASGKPETVKGKTTTGFAFEITADARDDYELFEDLVQLDSGNVAVMPRILSRLLGEKQKAALLEHCRDEKTGRVSTVSLNAELRRIMATVQALKK